MSITPKNLTAKLLGKKIVKVKSGSGEEMEFEIQRVNIETFAGENVAIMGKIVGKSEEELKKMMIDQFKSNEMSKILSPVLLEGISNPVIVDKAIVDCDSEKEVSIKTLLTDIELATRIYMEILQISVKENK